VERAKQVLIVDDDAIFRDFTASVLRAAGFEIDQADGGEVAIEKLKASAPDLVLLDLVMPRVDGWGVLDHVGRLRPRPPVIVISGEREIVPPGHLSQCVSGYFFKPFRAAQLVDICTQISSRPSVVAIGANRKETRRTFMVEATVFGEGEEVLARGRLVQLSAGGFRLELGESVPPGRSVRIAFSLPGHDRPIEVTGLVRWTDTLTIGAEFQTVTGSDQAVLRALLDLT
jgi:DNA-binding response OmpR family regulator